MDRDVGIPEELAIASGDDRPGALVYHRDLAAIPIDAYRVIVFPNRLREFRRAAGYAKLLPFAATLPEIPYIRLSKIERGEVIARADELCRIADALKVLPGALLIDIDDPAFDLAEWALPFADGKPIDVEEERFALLLGAALRARRAADPALTIATIEQRYGLPQVNLSRLENAVKPWGRWNVAVRSAVLGMFEAPNEAALRRIVLHAFAEGQLEPHLSQILDPEIRRARSRARIAALAADLGGVVAMPDPRGYAAPRVAPVPQAAPRDVSRVVPVYGAPLPGGLIDFVATGGWIDAPRDIGEGAFGLRVCRATLGGGLPGHATVVVDPARYPVAGGLAALREGTAWRLLSVTIDRAGVMTGYSVNPELERTLDGRDPADVAAVVAAIF